MAVNLSNLLFGQKVRPLERTEISSEVRLCAERLIAFVRKEMLNLRGRWNWGCQGLPLFIIYILQEFWVWQIVRVEPPQLLLTSLHQHSPLLLVLQHPEQPRGVHDWCLKGLFLVVVAKEWLPYWRLLGFLERLDCLKEVWETLDDIDDEFDISNWSGYNVGLGRNLCPRFSGTIHRLFPSERLVGLLDIFRDLHF